MLAPAVHKLTISFHKDKRVKPAYHYSGPNKGSILFFPEGDTMKIVFHCLDQAAQPTILTPILDAVGIPPGQPGAPFKEGLQIALPPPRILTAGSTKGYWGFSVAFAVNWPDLGTVDYLLPDPELQVGPKPGTCDGL